jgi:hypothetical protein
MLLIVKECHKRPSAECYVRIRCRAPQQLMDRASSHDPIFSSLPERDRGFESGSLQRGVRERHPELGELLLDPAEAEQTRGAIAISVSMSAS